MSNKKDPQSWFKKTKQKKTNGTFDNLKNHKCNTTAQKNEIKKKGEQTPSTGGSLQKNITTLTQTFFVLCAPKTKHINPQTEENVWQYEFKILIHIHIEQLYFWYVLHFKTAYVPVILSLMN